MSVPDNPSCTPPSEGLEKCSVSPVVVVESSKLIVVGFETGVPFTSKFVVPLPLAVERSDHENMILPQDEVCRSRTNDFVVQF